MSKQIDEKVVSMKFDNRQFEANVKTSMSTIDKLKSSLNFKSASKGLDDLQKASKKMSFDDLASSVQKLESRFSTLGIVGMRVVERFTDSVINGVNRISKAATSFIREGIIQGGKRRAMNLENAHFQLQGLLKDEEAVAAVMRNVSDSVDGTAYSLDSAAKVASQFAASGMKAGEQMFSALRAVAGVAAMTNSEYDDIGRIFTKVAGQGRLMGDDLLSLSSRGMNAAATLAESMGKSEAEIRALVSKGGVSFQEFADAMDDAFGEHAKKANETLTGALSNVKAALARIGALFVSPLVEQNGELVQLLNNVRVKINDIKSEIVPVADQVVEIVKKIVTKTSDLVKKLDVKKYFSKLSEIFTSSKWDLFIKKLNAAGISTDKFQEKLKEVASKQGISIDDLIDKYGSLGKVVAAGKLSKSILVDTLKKFVNVENDVSGATSDVTNKLEYFNKIVKEVIRGNYGNGAARVEELTKAGYKYATVQKLVNYVWERNGKTWSDCSFSADELTKVISNLSDEEMANAGFTEEQTVKIRELAEEAEKTGTPLNDLLSSLEKPSIKDLLIDSVRNSLKGLMTTARAVKDAFVDTFDFSSTSETLYNFVDAVHELTEKFVLSDERADKLKRSFSGLFAILDIVRMLVGGGLNLVFKILKAVLKAFDIDVLDVTATVGDAIVKFRDWLKEHDLLTKAVEFLAPVIKKIAGFIKDTAIAVYDWAKSNETIQKVLKKVQHFFEDSLDSIKKWVEGLKETDNVPKYILQGLVDGLKEGASKVFDIVADIGKGILKAIKKVLGIHSPSTEFFDVGKNVIAGFVEGIKKGSVKAYDALKKFGSKCIEKIKEIDFGAVLTAVFVGGVFITVNKLIKVLDKFANPFDKLGGVFDSFKNGIDSLFVSINKYVKSKTLYKTSDSVLNFAKAIGILVGSMYLLYRVISKDDDAAKTLWHAFGMMVALAGILGVLMVAMNKIKPGSALKIGSALIALSTSLLILAGAVKILSKLEWTQLGVAGVAMGGLMVIMAVLVRVAKYRRKIEEVQSVFGKIAKSMLVLAVAIRIMGGMEWTQLGVAGVAMGGLLVFITSLVLVTKKCTKKISDIGNTMLAIAGAIGILAIVVRMLGRMEWPQLGVAGVAMGGLLIIVTGLIHVVKKCGSGTAKIGSTMLAIAGAMGILAIVARILSKMSLPGIAKAIVGMLGLSVVVACLIKITQQASGSAPKIAKTLSAITGALATLAVIAVVLGLMKIDHLAQGVLAVAILGVLVRIMLDAAKDSQKATTALLAMAAMVGILGGVLYLLSKIDSTTLLKSAATLGVALVALAIALALISNFGGGAAAGAGLLVAASGLLVIAAAMLVLATIPIEKVGSSILMLVVALAALCGVAVLFSFFAVGAGLLTSTLLAMAAVVGAVGLAAIAFAGALYIVGKALPLIADGLAYLIVSLADCSDKSDGFLKMVLKLAIALALIAMPLGIIALSVIALAIALGVVAISALVFSGALALLGLALPLVADGITAIFDAVIACNGQSKEFLLTTLSLAAGLALLGLAIAVVGAGVIILGAGLLVLAVALLGISLAALLFAAALVVVGLGLKIIGAGLDAIGDGLNNLITSVASCKDSMGDFKSVMGTFGLTVVKLLLTLAGGLVAFAGGASIGALGAILLAAGIMILGAAVLFGALCVTALAGAFMLLGKALDVTVEAAEAGKNLVLGFAQGIKDTISSVVNTVKDFCGTVVGKVKDFLGIHSPSKIMEALGLNTGEGFKLGLEESKDGVKDSAESLANAATDGLSDAGSEGGSSFLDGLGDKLDLESFDLGSFDMDSLKDKFGSAGSEGGSSFLGSIGSEVDENRESVTSKFSGLGSDSATAFKEGLTSNLDLSKIDIGELDEATIKGRFKNAGSESGASFTSELTAALSTTEVNASLESMISAIIEFHPKMQETAQNFAKKFSEGFVSEKEPAVKGASELAVAVLSAIKNDEQYDEFKIAGKYLGEGLIEGIEYMQPMVRKAGYTLGQIAVQGEKDGQQSRSPSRLTMQAGKWLGEGLILGIRATSGAVYKSSKELGDTAATSISSAISRIADFVNSDIDAQPTIRPVLDLSDVENGANAISGMFSSGTLSLNTRAVGTIAASMAERQNGRNSDDIVSAINKLRNDITDMPRNNYSINGITYDDGSNVSDAVRALVRAARIEERT